VTRDRPTPDFPEIGMSDSFRADHAPVIMSTTVDVSDSLDEARTRLLKAARALNGAWAAALCAMVLLVLVSLALLLVAATVRPVYVVIWSVLLAATGFNVTRFWPRRRERVGELLTKAEVAAVRRVVDPEGRVAWPGVVRLVPQPELELTEGELRLGMPLLACLDEGELRELLLVAAVDASLQEERSVRWALRVAHGDIGRPLVGRRPRLTWPTSRLTQTLRARTAALEADLGNWAGACARAAAMTRLPSSAAQSARDQVAEAWLLLCSEWLDPAFSRGRRHVAPFTGLRHFVEAADAAGWLSQPRPWWSPTGTIADLMTRHEEAVACLLGGRGDRLVPITWEEHPAEVTVPRWRALVTEVLDAARRSTYDPAITLESVLALMEAGHAPMPAEDSQVLSAAIAIAAIDSGQFHPTWSWPEGTALDADDGWTLPLASIAGEVLGMVRDGTGLDKAYAELREALEELGIDALEPLWLDQDPGVRPERPIGSFAARQGLAARVVVVTDRVMHVFRDAQGPRLSGLVSPASGRDPKVELRKHMLAVWQGDTTDQVLAVAAVDVRRARLGPATGGLWWRLTLTIADGAVVLRGRGDGSAEAVEVTEWLGDRVETTWLHAAPGVRNLRNAVGLAALTLGTLGVLWGVLLTVVHPDGMPEPLPAALALGGFGALLIALLPDAVVELVHRSRRGHRSEPVSGPG
jgi:hypothetical protein